MPTTAAYLFLDLLKSFYFCIQIPIRKKLFLTPVYKSQLNFLKLQSVPYSIQASIRSITTNNPYKKPMQYYFLKYSFPAKTKQQPKKANIVLDVIYSSKPTYTQCLSFQLCMHMYIFIYDRVYIYISTINKYVFVVIRALMVINSFTCYYKGDNKKNLNHFYYLGQASIHL